VHPEHTGGLQAKEIRRVATELVRRISLLKGCLPSTYGYTGKQLLAAAGRVNSVAGALSYRRRSRSREACASLCV